MDLQTFEVIALSILDPFHSKFKPILLKSEKPIFLRSPFGGFLYLVNFVLLCSLTEQNYDMVGWMMAYSTVHNRPLPTFFNWHMYTAISESCSHAEPDVCDISDLDMQMQLYKVSLLQADTISLLLFCWQCC